MKYIIANWKAHKTLKDAVSWIDTFLNLVNGDKTVRQRLDGDELRVIIASPFPFLVPLAEKISSFKNIGLASQDISAKGKGSFTGEVTGEMLQGIVSYSIVGHSERRKYQHESFDDVHSKIEEAIRHGITPIYCMQDDSSVIPSVQFIAYEPEKAIGTGNNELPENILEFKKSLQLHTDSIFLYGGSVDVQNINVYANFSEIDGYLVGSTSLDPQDFFILLTKV
jgi:triosephosphate isomerase